MIRIITKDQILRTFCSTFMGLAILCSNAAACSCIERAMVENMASSDQVFHGKILEINQIPPTEENRFGEPLLVVTFEVINNFKGGKEKQRTLHTFKNRSSCKGLLGPLELGAEWIIFASEMPENDAAQWRTFAAGRVMVPKKLVSTGVCSGNRGLQPGNAEDFKGTLEKLKLLKKVERED